MFAHNDYIVRIIRGRYTHLSSRRCIDFSLVRVLLLHDAQGAIIMVALGLTTFYNAASPLHTLYWLCAQ
jgi:hypothetical protein